MAWRRLGKLFEPPSDHAWMASHASYPCPFELEPNVYGVLFSSRDKLNRSSTGYLVVSLGPSPVVLDLHNGPILTPGEPGSFDDSGTTPCAVVVSGHQTFLYYLGWNLGTTVPFRNSIGLAVSENGAGFHKHSKVPIMDRSEEDPLSLSYPSVVEENGEFKMWYGTTRAWSYKEYEMLHVLTNARSSDGIHWTRSGVDVIAPSAQDEYAFSRPSVIKHGAKYRMWFSVRGPYYRIGYAESPDGITWERDDSKFGLDRGDDDWENEMVEYPAVVSNGDSLFMFYNGNQYGKTGFGVVVWE